MSKIVPYRSVTVTIYTVTISRSALCSLIQGRISQNRKFAKVWVSMFFETRFEFLGG